MSIDPTDPAMQGVVVHVTHHGQREDKGRTCPRCKAWTLRSMLDESNPKRMRCGAPMELEQKEDGSGITK